MLLDDPSALARALRGLASDRDDPYPSVDLRHARLLGAVLWLVGGSFALLLLPLAPPTHAFGWPGWIVAGGGIAGCFAGSPRRSPPPACPSAGEAHVGMTCGVAEYRPGQSPAEVLAGADDVLLALKRSQAPTDTERVRLERSLGVGGVDG